MTETEWLTCSNPHHMFDHVRDTAARSKGGCRKLRLFGCGSVRGIWPLLTDERSRQAVEVSEQYADDLIDDQQLRTAFDDAVGAIDFYATPGAPDFLASQAGARVASEEAEAAADIIVHVSLAGLAGTTRPEPVQARQHFEFTRMCQLFRCIFGNPFRLVTLNARWQSSTVLDLARSVYDQRAFQNMPILADAVKNSGCDNEEIIQHCRGPGPHVRGCWVVDLLLNKG